MENIVTMSKNLIVVPSQTNENGLIYVDCLRWYIDMDMLF